MLFRSNVADGTAYIGGQYSSKAVDADGAVLQNADPVVLGLTAGTYTVGIRAYKKVGAAYLESAELKTGSVTIKDAVPTTFTYAFTPGATSITIPGEQNAVKVVKSSDVTIAVTASQSFKGKWGLDAGQTAIDSLSHYVAEGNVNGSTFNIVLTDLEDGMHTIDLSGTGESGDGATDQIRFVVDTTAPVLQLASPQAGSLFEEDGTVVVSGYIEPDATLKVMCEGQTLFSGKVTVDQTGFFTKTISGLPKTMSAVLDITVADAVGNISQVKSVKMSNRGLGNVKYMAIFANNTDYTDKSLPEVTADSSINLEACIVTKAGTKIDLPRSEWHTPEPHSHS